MHTAFSESCQLIFSSPDLDDMAVPFITFRPSLTRVPRSAMSLMLSMATSAFQLSQITYGSCIAAVGSEVGGWMLASKLQFQSCFEGQGGLGEGWLWLWVLTGLVFLALFEFSLH